MIHLNCPGCGKAYSLPVQSQGRHATCNDCETRFVIAASAAPAQSLAPAKARRAKPPEPAARVRRAAPPENAPAAKPARDAAQPRKPPKYSKHPILDGFRGDFPRPRVTFAHRVTALFAAGTMLVLPLLYIAITIGVAWLTWWHATHNYVWMKVPVGRLRIVVGLVYVMLIVAGVLWVLSLIKPVFIRIASRGAQRGLSREDEPLLFAFADRLADEVGSPHPEIITINPEVNASASYETRAFGLGRRTFTLTLGIPLIAGLSLAQLTGVMAHEFGHFSQRGSTLLDRFIHRVNLWFAIAVHRHDLIDDIIDSMHIEPNALSMLAGFTLLLVVWLGRAVLWCLMCVGLLVSATFTRRMEFDADQYQAGVIGTKTFESTTKKIITLSVAHTVAMHYVLSSVQADHLPDDFAEFVSGLATQSRRLRKKSEKMLRKEKARWFASHPPMQARIDAVRKLDLPGIFHSGLPATALFRQFQTRSRSVTRLLYHIRFGPYAAEAALRPAADAVQTYLDVMENRAS